MTDLDARSLAVVAMLVAVCLASGLSFLLYLLGRRPGLASWVGSLWLSAGGMLLIGLRGAVPEGASILLGNGLLALGSGQVWRGARQYSGLPAPWVPVLAGVGLLEAALAWFHLVTPSLGVRVAAFSLSSAVWSGLAAAVFLRHGPPETRASCRFAAAIFVVDALLALGRLLVPLPGDAGQDLFRSGPLLVATVLEGLVSTIAWCLTFVFLTAERLIAELAHLARTDDLTGLLNRRAFSEEGHRTLDLCRRQGLACSVLVVDLDFFKEVNDAHGHAGGDQALREFARLARGCFRSVDVVGRQGGEEFAVVMPGAGPDQAAAAGERLRLALERAEVPLGSGRVRLTASIGTASGQGVSVDLERLLSRADVALYCAKREGRNRVVAAPAV